MKYLPSNELTEKARSLALQAGMNIPTERIYCVKSTGSNSRRVIARIHTFGKAIQIGANLEPVYVIELISEKFDRQSEEEKNKTLIHELLHIPKAFGGGFRGHRKHANRKNVEKIYGELTGKNTEKKSENAFTQFLPILQ